MEISRGFRAPFKDAKWTGKVAIGVLVSAVPVLNVAVSGWGIEYVRLAATGQENQLPEWGNLGAHWVRGITFWFISILYYLPAIVIVIAFGVPGAALGAVQADGLSSPTAVLGSVLMGLFVALAYVLVVSLFVQAARCNYAVYGTFSSAFNIKEILSRVRMRPSAYILAWVATTMAVWGAGIVAGFVASIVGAVPCLGQLSLIVLFPLFWGFGLIVGMGANGVWGQYARHAYEDSWQGGSTAPIFEARAESPAPQVAGIRPPATVPPIPGTVGSADPSPAQSSGVSGLAGQAAVAAALSRAMAQPEPTPEPEPEPTPEPAGVRFELERVAGPGTIGERWILPNKPIHIGRGSDCLVSVADGKASRMHSVLTPRADGLQVEDLGSSNGTFVRGERLTGDAALAFDGDEVRVGDTVMVVHSIGQRGKAS